MELSLNKQLCFHNNWEEKWSVEQGEYDPQLLLSVEWGKFDLHLLWNYQWISNFASLIIEKKSVSVEWGESS